MRSMLITLMLITATTATEPCRVEVQDADSGWPVPLVELRSTNNQRFVSDNGGVIAIDSSDLLGRECFFFVHGHGYEADKDGFGFQGVRLTPEPGGQLKIKVHRRTIATRLGRLTGSGLFAESQKIGERQAWKDGPLVGCDSVQLTQFAGRAFWNWGDTQVYHYPLGNFHMTGATSIGMPITSPEPPIEPQYDYYLDAQGRPKSLAKMEGKGPTWLTGYATVRDRAGNEQLVATYRKIAEKMVTYEIGLCRWSSDLSAFQPLRKIWSKSDGQPEPAVLPVGHSVLWSDPETKQQWLLMGDPLPSFRCPATYEAWSNPDSWQAVDSVKELNDVDSGAKVTLHSGSIAWNAYRRKWVSIFMQKFGKPSAFGEIWYAEADAPTGPWSKTVKVLSHNNYTFYNPRLWGEFSQPESPILLFEGTYTEQFANQPNTTPRYDYNQILYRIDLDDPRLKPVQGGSR